jgi:hypothetical protein
MTSSVVTMEGLVGMRNAHKIFVGNPVGKRPHVDLNVD